MTTDELAEYYAKLLVMQYAKMPKAFATIKAMVTPVLMDQLPMAVASAYNIEDSIGTQLDILGKYVGISRHGNGLTGPITLNDADFRTLMKLVIIKNNAGSSLATIQSLLSANFPGEVFVSDNQIMGLNYVVLESLGTSDLLEILTTGGHLPRPMGVQTSVVVLADQPYPYFGFRDYNSADPTVSPFNNYDFYITTAPWLSYSGAI